MTDHPTGATVGEARSRGQRERWAMHTSIFARLLAVMVTMAVCLLLLVTVFFKVVAGPIVSPAIHRMTQPDVAGHPTTHTPSSSGPREAAASRPNEAHTALFVVLLVVMAGVVLGAHVVLKRSLEPLRALSDGVTRLSAGELDVVLPKGTHDEFGTLTDAFNQMVRRVRAMIGARDQLLLDVSHELRSPITRMKVALELLPAGERQARLAEDLAEMERMVTELLELERLRQSGGISPTRQDVMRLLHEIAQGFQDRPPGVRIVSGPPALHAMIDGERVRVVLRNLLDNAVKYSSPTSRPVEITAAQDGHDLVIRVADDGIGIPDGDLDRVFEPFFRVDRSRSRGTGGYGLGLSICKRVMEAHGGSISVERRMGSGTSFVLAFPKAAIAESR